MIASEAQPFSKTGGLADVATALPKALGRLGHDVTLITPRYRGIADGPVVGRVSLEVAAHRFSANLMRSAHRSRARACCCSIVPSSTIAPASITTPRGDYADNAVRYAFLSAAAIDWASQQDDALRHHPRARLAGRSRAGLRAVTFAPPHAPHPRTVFTIHNLAYQGIFDKSWVPRLGLCRGRTSRSTASSSSIA